MFHTVWIFGTLGERTCNRSKRNRVVKSRDHSSLGPNWSPFIGVGRNRRTIPGGIQRQEDSDQPREMIKREDRAIVKFIFHSPHPSLSTILRVIRIPVIGWTSERGLGEGHLSYRWLSITCAQPNERMEWYWTHWTWYLTDWGRIAFITEFRLKLHLDNQGTRVWKRLGQRWHPNLTIVSQTAKQRKLWSWGPLLLPSMHTYSTAVYRLYSMPPLCCPSFHVIPDLHFCRIIRART